MSHPAPSRPIHHVPPAAAGALLALAMAASGSAPAAVSAADLTAQAGVSAADLTPPAVPAGMPPGTALPDLSQLPTLTLRELLESTANRLTEVRRIELRREEAIAELDHLRASRAFQVEVEGNYSEEEMDRYELNGDRVKEGEQEDIRRRMTFSITHPLLGQSVEDRILTASQELRLVELQESAEATRSEATLTLIGAYVDLAAEQRHRELRTQALVLATEKVRVLEERAARGEILQRDVLAAKADLADRRAEAAEGARREVELLADIAVLVDGEAPGPFRAGALDWAKMMPAASMPPPAVKAPAPAISRGVRSSVWYNLPEIDLRFYYSIASRDRTFADEVDDEEGHIPGIEVTLEFPLELWRSGKSFARQVEARHERQRLAVLAIQRETAGRATAAAMAHAEAAARLAAAEAKLALREEDRRVARLKADDVGASAVRSELNMIAAELAVIDSQVDVAFEQGELARRYFERGMVEGSNPIELAMATSCSPCRERVAEAAPAVGRESGL